MKVLLVLAIVATARAAPKAASFAPGLPLGLEYQNVKLSPCEQAALNNNGGSIVSSTPAPIDSAFVTSSSSPLGVSSGFASSTLYGNEFGPIVSSTPQTPIFSSNVNEFGPIVSSTPQAPIFSSNVNEFGPIVSSTPQSPIFSSTVNEFGPIVSSTPQTPIFSSTVNVDNVNGGYFSSTPAPALLNQNFNSYLSSNIETNPVGLSQFPSGNGQFIGFEGNSFSNGLVQPIPSGLPDFSSLSIQSTTSGGSINEAFGVSEEFTESQSQKPEISKNVFFFAAPEEPEPVKPKIRFEETKKNVNLVFIKAPAAPSLGTIEITPPRQESAEKTVVYVLVKKPEEQQNILVKSAPAVKPNKPDVFFIKYKNEEEAKNSISKVQAQHSNVENQLVGQELNQFGELFNIENARDSLQSKPIAGYLSGAQLLQQSVTPGFSSSTESTFSTLGNAVTQVSPVQVPVGSFSNVNYGINNIPLIYSTPRPQVEINAISNNENLDNFISIGGRSLSSEIVGSSFDPIIESSSVTPFASSSQLPINFSSTVRPSITSLNPFYKKK